MYSELHTIREAGPRNESPFTTKAARMAKHQISLQPTERTLVTAAATIYAAYITAGRVAEGQESAFMDRAIQAAIRIAKVTDDSVQADQEFH